VRAPRLIGLRAALDLILSGRQLDAQRARKIGLVDQLLPSASFAEDALKVAQSFARIGKKPLRGRSLLLRLQDSAPARWLIQRLTGKAVLARTRGHYPALPLALDVTVSPAGNAAPIRRAAIVGAGIMGAGIAELFAYQTVPVQVVDIDEQRVQAGLSRARELLKKAAARANWSEEELRSRSGCLRGATGYDGFERVDIVVEAVVEQMDVKRKVIAQIESRVLPDATIASNTSALSVSELQENLEQPGRVCGLHFFNPPHRMPLVEIVRGALTSDDTLATAFSAAIRLGKTPVVVEDSPGFVVNRILAAYLTEAGHLLHSGMTVQQLDGVMQNFGMPVGPARLLDEIGLDVVAEVSRTMVDGFGERFKPAPVMGRVLATGVTGRKGGRGFYDYDGSKSKGVNKEIERVLREAASSEKPSASDASERMVLSMVNEASRILDDGIVGSAESLDVAMIMGTGFPPFRGGLLRYADALSLPHVVERLRHFAGRLGPRFEPAPGLLRRGSFYAAE
jgi:3-hydroxyacyl-CoA dehydrogenase/enoyl-CoA hydratase/3-hydroxybutyryl-CoA epimerase